MGRNLCAILQLGQDLRRQLFAEFDTPLVKAVDVPDYSLNKYLVLVDGQNLPKGFGRETGNKNRVGWLVTCKSFVRPDSLDCLWRFF